MLTLARAPPVDVGPGDRHGILVGAEDLLRKGFAAVKRQGELRRCRSLARSTKLMLQTERLAPQLEAKVFERRPRQNYALIFQQQLSASIFNRLSCILTKHTHPSPNFIGTLLALIQFPPVVERL